jgi:hypothetical protein
VRPVIKPAFKFSFIMAAAAVNNNFIFFELKPFFIY